MAPRSGNPAFTVPDAMPALMALDAAIRQTGVPEATRELMHLRASQINGCSVCVDMHANALKKSGESDQRLFSVAAWRDAPWFDERERALLALTESVTRLADRPDPVSDEVWREAAKHHDETTLGALIMSIALVNLWNRVNIASGQVAGAVSH